MTDNDYTHMTILLDRSGSMSSIRADMEGALEQFLTEQREQPGRATVSLIAFDDVAEHVLDFTEIDDVGFVQIVPRGNTALIDAWVHAIDDTGNRLARLSEHRRPGVVLFVVITDGQENASRRYTKAQVAARVRTQSDVYKWEFIYLGANQDAVAEARQYGVPMHATMDFAATHDGVTASTQSLSQYASATRTSGTGTQHFDDSDRSAAK